MGWGLWRAEGLWDAGVEHGWLGRSPRCRRKAASPEPLSCRASCLSFLRHPPGHLRRCLLGTLPWTAQGPLSLRELLWPSPVPAPHSTFSRPPGCHGVSCRLAGQGCCSEAGPAVSPLCTGNASVCTPLLLFWHEETLPHSARA